MKVIIAGGRSFCSYELMVLRCNSILRNQPIVEIVSGTAGGADKLGERYAKEYGHSVKQFPAEWDKYGKGAGYIRNEEMAKYAEGLIAFWDGQSRGTKHMIDLAYKYNLKVEIIKY